MNANEGSFTVKEVVVEIRDTVKDLAKKLDRIDREGSIGTRGELDDHEARLRRLEERPIVKREEIHDLKNDIAAVNLWREGFVKAAAAITSLKRWQITVALSLAAVVAGLIGSVATILWLKYGG